MSATSRNWYRLPTARGTLVAVDNTTATFLGQRPLELGADFSVSSDTKSITGHDDLILGHVAVREASWGEKLAKFRTQQGAVPGPMEVWLAHRSLATLDLRLRKQCENAQGIAEFLSGRQEVRSVRYPGLPDDPSHAVASRQMRHFGPIVGFDLGDKARAERFLSECHLVLTATSFGGLRTSAERRARWGGDAIPEGFIRLNAGCEDLEDLLDDMATALSSA
jgi:cystathionine gamma-lyase